MEIEENSNIHSLFSEVLGALDDYEVGEAGVIRQEQIKITKLRPDYEI